MFDFEKEKKECLDKLYKPDKSKKGDVDTEMIPLINIINSKENYFTTSSCSGRISIFTIDVDNKKNTANWIFVSHVVVGFQQILDALKDLPSTIVRFKFEPLIIHICCKTIDDAKKLILICQEIGLKDSGIMSLNEKIIVKINGSERIDAPVGVDGKLIVDENYLKFVTELANEKLKKTHEKIQKLQKIFLKNNE
ncbi:MAG: tRNA wybutosine-synthesizing 3 family protein [Candidatus Woesearchaeota archaeon]